MRKFEFYGENLQVTTDPEGNMSLGLVGPRVRKLFKPIAPNNIIELGCTGQVGLMSKVWAVIKVGGFKQDYTDTVKKEIRGIRGGMRRAAALGALLYSLENDVVRAIDPNEEKGELE